MRPVFFAAHCAMFDLKKNQASAQNVDVKFSGHFIFGQGGVHKKKCPENLTLKV